MPPKHATSAPATPDRTPLAIIALAALMFVTSIAALVTLALSGQDTASIERIVGPLLSSVIVTGVIGAVAAGQRETAKAHETRLTEQDEKLAKIDAQTNGVLDARMERAVARVLATTKQD